MQEVVDQFSRTGGQEKIPLIKTSFSVTIKAIVCCMFGELFDDQTKVDSLSAAYMAAWEEMEVS